jgi:hypothetical protein
MSMAPVYSRPVRHLLRRAPTSNKRSFALQRFDDAVVTTGRRQANGAPSNDAVDGAIPATNAALPWHRRVAPNQRPILAPRPLRASAWCAKCVDAAIFHIIRLRVRIGHRMRCGTLRCGSRSCRALFLARWRSRHRCASSYHASCDGRNAT